MTTKVDAALLRLASRNAEAEPYVVGGALRDALLGIAADEVDMVVEGAEEWVAEAAACLGARATQIGREPEVWRLALEDGWLDIAEPVGDLAADLARRDFTVNAMAAPLGAFLSGDLQGALIDPLGGREDVAERRLALAAPAAIADDPLRILRGVRFEATRGLRMTAEAEAAARRQAATLSDITAERVWLELARIMSHEQASRSVRRMDELGALDATFPELALGRGVDQRPVHRRDVFNHQLDALEWLDALISPERPLQPTAARLWTELWRSEAFAEAAALREQLWETRLTLRLATLLHDIGKPQTRRVEADGRTRFFGHSELGAELVEARLTALRAPGSVVHTVQTLILHHLRPGQVAAPGRVPTDRALYRFHAALGELTAPLCWLFLADSLATVGGEALAPRWAGYVAHVARIVHWRPRRRVAAPRLLDGRALMALTGLPPGPALGRMLDTLDEASAVGEIETAEQARALAVRLAASARREAKGAGVD